MADKEPTRENGEGKKPLLTMINELLYQVEGDFKAFNANVQRTKDASLRQSYTALEMEVEKRNLEHVKRTQELNVQHISEMESKKEELSELKQYIQLQDNEINHLKGRLDASRTSRQTCLDEMRAMRSRHDEKVKELEDCISDSRDKLAELEVEKERRKSDVEQVKKLQKILVDKQEEAESSKRQISELEQKIYDLDSTIQKLEDEKVCITKQMEGQKREIDELRQQLATETDLVTNAKKADDTTQQILQNQLNFKNKEYDEVKQRLEDEERKRTSYLKEMASLRTQLKQQSVEVCVLNTKKNSLERQLAERDDQFQRTRQKLIALESKDATSECKLKTLEQTVDSLKDQLAARDQNFATLTSLKGEISNENVMLKCKVDSLLKEIDDLKKKMEENRNYEELLNSKDKALGVKEAEFQQQKLLIERLKHREVVLMDTVKALDGQLHDFQLAIEKKLSELDEIMRIKDLLEKENTQIRDQLRTAKIELNEARSLKAFTEKRLETTENSLKSETQLKESELRSNVERLNVAIKRNEDMSKELNDSLNRISLLESEKFELRKSYESLSGEKERLLKERDMMLRGVVDVKDENIKFKEALSAALSKGEYYKELAEKRLDELARLEDELKLNEIKFIKTIEQQKAAIEKLIEIAEKKKKPGLFTPKSKEKQTVPTGSRTPASSTFKSMCARATLGAHPTRVHPSPMTPAGLEEERREVLQLEQKRGDLQSKLQGLKEQTNASTTCKPTPTLPAPRREENILLKERCNTISGAQFGDSTGGRSHKCCQTRNDHIRKCMACWEPIYKGRPISYCQNCDYSFHMACALVAGDTCGLSEKKTYEIEKVESSKRAEPISNGTDKDARGFVKVRIEKMQLADTRLVVIEDGKLKVYVSEVERKVGKPSAVFVLNEKTIIYYRVNEKDPVTKSKNTPFAMKVTFFHEDGSSSYLYMFHDNQKQKRYWLHAILKYTKVDSSASDTTVSSECSFSSDENKENERNKVVRVLETPLVNLCFGKLYVNSVQYIADRCTYVMACDSGLYSVKDASRQPVKIEGPSAVYDIIILETVKLVVFIQGQDRTLATVYYGLLKSCAEAAQCSKPKITPQIIPHTRDCYMLAARGSKLDDTVVAAAYNNGLFICTMKNGDLSVVKQILVQSSITSLLVTPHTVLYGTDNVYELDTKTYQVEEFLDYTDDSIYYIKVINETHGSYPVAVLDVSESKGLGDNDREYLICFQDVGVFVDSFGRRSRDGDVLWSQVPVAFEYQHPYLFIVHFTTVEVQKIDALSYTKLPFSTRARITSDVKRPDSQIIIPEIRFLPVNSKSSPSLVGKGARGVVVALHEAQAVKVMELAAS